jgi:hypothetical protein
MLIHRLQFADLIWPALMFACFCAGLGVRPLVAAEPEPGKEPEKPLRVLLFADAPSRDFQFMRSLLVKQVERKQAELSIVLQSSGAKALQDVPPERLLKEFPTRLVSDEKKDVADNYGNLAQYDLLIAFDPDWTKLSAEQGKLLEQWVQKEGHGLIMVAGPINCPNLGDPDIAPRLKPILDMLPVALADSRAVKAPRNAENPWTLSFPVTEKFLKLDEKGKDDLAGWSEFFYGKQREDWQKTDDTPTHGFYSPYPVKFVKPAALTLARYRDPRARIDVGGGKLEDLPYLVTMPYGKGRTVYLGSGETWRLRQLSETYHERFWNQLARYAASFPPTPATPGSGSR